MKKVIIIIIALLTVSKAYSQNFSESLESRIESFERGIEELIKEIDSFESELEDLEEWDKSRKRREKLPEQRDSLYSIEEELSRRIDSLSRRISEESNYSIKGELKRARIEEADLRSEVRKKLRKQRLESLQVQCIDSISGIFTITCEGFLKYTLKDSHFKEIISGEFINGKAEIDARNLKQESIYDIYNLILSDETERLYMKIYVYYGLKTGVEVIDSAGDKDIRITIGKPRHKNLYKTC